MNYAPYYQPYQFGAYTPTQPRYDAPGVNMPTNTNAATGPVVGQSQGFIVRPVTSREEAVAAQVDFFGPGTLMPDLAHGTIYLKRFNQNTGSSDMFVFSVEQKDEPVQYATRDDLAQLREEIEALKGKRVKRDDE